MPNIFLLEYTGKQTLRFFVPRQPFYMGLFYLRGGTGNEERKILFVHLVSLWCRKLLESKLNSFIVKFLLRTTLCTSNL